MVHAFLPFNTYLMFACEVVYGSAEIVKWCIIHIVYEVDSCRKVNDALHMVIVYGSIQQEQ